ncbi:histidine phosphotransferase family protein [Pseudoruegeria sp. SK021]|uniref:histidine phosphotransferase family protein n=1 Tax=Pseudoruegeria sp. SK021 TaxID=1933035 RepID=UPI000A23F2F2|nr:histidine phosphotransferase family protein [Pseudoruegeria sp. SK021]OSP56368.1 histidine phosphotransferase [Pseudoruegeria sp. SK021]
MNQIPRDLVALLGSRICHDLISPIGAIGNGLELMEMSRSAEGPEMDLIKASLLNAQARIRFFRISYGATGDGQAIGSREVKSILQDFTIGGRVRIDWQTEGEVHRDDTKLVFLLLQCLDTAMPYGGDVRITRSDRSWTLSAQAKKLKALPELWSHLDGDPKPGPITPAQVQFALAPQQAAAMQRKLFVRVTDTEINLQF